MNGLFAYAYFHNEPQIPVIFYYYYYYLLLFIIIIYLFKLYSVQTKLPFKTETVAKIKVKQKIYKILHKKKQIVK